MPVERRVAPNRNGPATPTTVPPNQAAQTASIGDPQQPNAKQPNA